MKKHRDHEKRKRKKNRKKKTNIFVRGRTERNWWIRCLWRDIDASWISPTCLANFTNKTWQFAPSILYTNWVSSVHIQNSSDKNIARKTIQTFLLSVCGHAIRWAKLRVMWQERSVSSMLQLDYQGTCWPCWQSPMPGNTTCESWIFWLKHHSMWIVFKGRQNK